MFTRLNLKDAVFQQATGRKVAELVSSRATGAVGVTCRVVEIFPETQGGVRAPHVHDDLEEVIYVLQGQGRAWVDGEETVVTAGDLLVIPMQSSHRIINPGAGALRLLCFFPSGTVGIP